MKQARDYSEEINTILDRQEQHGGPFWSRADGDIHAPHGSSTMDTLEVLGELGANRKEHLILINAIDFVFQYQTLDGCFRYAKSSSKLPCISARILAAMGRLGGGRDQRTEISYQQLLDSQGPDGGWRCNTVKLGKSPQTDASNPGTTLYVLDAFRFRKDKKKEMILLETGVDFLLRHWETRIPLGPCDFGMGSRFFRIEFPFLRYNFFYYVYVLSFHEAARKDKRFQDAYSELCAKTIDGNIVPENPHRAWREFDFAKPGHVSDLATERFTEIEGNINSN